jgi:hypothetical protein
MRVCFRNGRDVLVDWIVHCRYPHISMAMVIGVTNCASCWKLKESAIVEEGLDADSMESCKQTAIDVTNKLLFGRGIEIEQPCLFLQVRVLDLYFS